MVFIGDKNCTKRYQLPIYSRKIPAVLSNPLFLRPDADVAKLADALDLGSSAARRVGSTPSIRTD